MIWSLKQQVLLLFSMNGRAEGKKEVGTALKWMDVGWEAEQKLQISLLHWHTGVWCYNNNVER